VVATGGYGRAY